MSKTDLSVSEVMDSLTGFEEIAIEKHMAYDIYTDDEAKARPVLLMRCLVFVLEKRAGLKDTDAMKAAMGMSVKDVNDYFPDTVEDVEPNDPDTDEGKDDSEPDGEPTS
jgi:hypothetical protein